MTKEYKIANLTFEKWKEWIDPLIKTTTYENLLKYRRLIKKRLSELTEEEKTPFLEIAKRINNLK